MLSPRGAANMRSPRAPFVPVLPPLLPGAPEAAAAGSKGQHGDFKKITRRMVQNGSKCCLLLSATRTRLHSRSSPRALSRCVLPIVIRSTSPSLCVVCTELPRSLPGESVLGSAVPAEIAGGKKGFAVAAREQTTAKGSILSQLCAGSSARGLRGQAVEEADEAFIDPRTGLPIETPEQKLDKRLNPHFQYWYHARCTRERSPDMNNATSRQRVWVRVRGSPDVGGGGGCRTVPVVRDRQGRTRYPNVMTCHVLAGSKERTTWGCHIGSIKRLLS